MTRILLVHQPVDGGVGRHVADLATGLAQRGHEVVLCGPSRPAGVPADAPHITLEMGRAVAPGPDARAVGRLRRIVQAVDPDIVHAHSSKAGAIARAARLAFPRRRVIYTPHGYAFAGHFERDTERTVYRAAELALAPMTTAVLAVCDYEAGLARGVAPLRPVRVVRNGIPVAAGPETDPDPVMSALRSRGPVIGTLTQLRPGKGVETLLDAFALLRIEAQLAIWGDGPDLAGLRARAHRLGIADAVTFAGATAHPLAAIAGADVFVLPSLAEAFPYVVLEAMSMCRPVIASDIGGVGEALAGTGVLVAPSDAPALARAMSELIADPDRRAALGAAGRHRIETELTADAMLTGIERVYAEFAARRR